MFWVLALRASDGRYYSKGRWTLRHSDLLARRNRGDVGVKLQNICSGELPYRRYI